MKWKKQFFLNVLEIKDVIIKIFLNFVKMILITLETNRMLR